jgi:transposase
MPARRELTMRQLRQMLRPHHEGVSAREIGRTLGVARSTIQDNLERARAAGIGWPLPAEWTDEVLEQRLFARSGVKPGRRRCKEPDWTALARELKQPGVNLMVVWEEYRQLHPDGYGYSRFCDLYREFERRISPVMRQHHVAGDKVFVDYSGKKIAIVDPVTGEVREAEIFVAVLGATLRTDPGAIPRAAVAGGRRPMSLLDYHQEYLSIRRSLGYDLRSTERILRRFVEFVGAENAPHVTTALFLHWQDGFGLKSHTQERKRLAAAEEAKRHRKETRRGEVKREFDRAFDSYIKGIATEEETCPRLAALREERKALEEELNGHAATDKRRLAPYR